MSPLEHPPSSLVRELLRDAAQLFEPQAVIESVGGLRWTVVLDASREMSLDVECGDCDSIVLATTVANAPDPLSVRTCEMLLRFNAAWRQTGGYQFSMAGSRPLILMTLQIPAYGLGAAKLAGVMANMVDAADAWREIMARPQLAGDRAVHS